MEREIQNNYFTVRTSKEDIDSGGLVEVIKKDGWMSSEVIIVNCFPYYSSRLTQYVNHRLSHLNKNELYEQVVLEMPHNSSNQVWNSISKSYEIFDTYLKSWVNENVYSSVKYLFVSSDTTEVRELNKIRTSVRQVLDNSNFRFASLYIYKNSKFIPDYYVYEVDREKQGEILFQWENIDNPNY